MHQSGFSRETYLESVCRTISYFFMSLSMIEKCTNPGTSGKVENYELFLSKTVMPVKRNNYELRENNYTNA